MVINAYSDERLKIAVDYFIARLEFVDDKVVYNLEKNAYLGKYTDYIATNVDIFGVALSEFSLVYPKNLSSYELKAVDDIVDCIGRNTGAILKTYDDSVATRPYEILMGRTNREVSEQIYSTLSINEYILRICQDTEGVKLVISYSNALSVDALLKQMDYEFANNKKLLVDFKGEVMEERMIVSKITQLRDPYILLSQNTCLC